MLGCARIEQFILWCLVALSPNELASRIDDSKAKIILSASCGFEPGRTIEYKPLLKKQLN